MHIAEQDLKLVREIVRCCLPDDVHVMVYGSRSTGRNLKPFSDLDLCLKGTAPLSVETLSQLRQAFENSNLPYQVDLVDWAQLQPEFRSAISHDLMPLAVNRVSDASR